MSTPYRQLLDAAIGHLEHLKAQGVRYVQVTPANLKGLAEAPPLRPSSARAVRPVTAATTDSVPIPARPPEQIRPRGAETEPPSSPILAKSHTETTPAGPVLEQEAKAQAMAELREQALACLKCPHLVAERRNVVFGVGNIDAALMFIGEAPGADEDAQGEPFVGRAGQLLTKMIGAMGLSRETVYIANILKCRPDTPGQSSGNRKPTPQEMETCIPYLHRQIDLIQPRVIVALGGTALEGLVGKTAGITRLRGQWQIYRSIPLMPTFHPSYLLRPENAAQKRKVWEDMLEVMAKLELSISEKQRGYFLRGSA